MADAVPGILGRNPCSKKTSPSAGKQKVYCATTEQVWQLHDAMPEHLPVAVLLGAFAGLRVAEVSGLRVADVDFIRGIVHPVQQWPAEPLKTEGRDCPIPIPNDLALVLSASVQQWPSTMMVTNGSGSDKCGPWIIERAVRDVKPTIEGLPAEFSFHDLRHYFASLLINSGADIKTVQARMRPWRRRRSTPTGICGRMQMSPPVLRLVLSLPNGWTQLKLLRTHCVLGRPILGVNAGQRISWLTRRNTARTHTDAA